MESERAISFSSSVEIFPEAKELLLGSEKRRKTKILDLMLHGVETWVSHIVTLCHWSLSLWCCGQSDIFCEWLCLDDCCVLSLMAGGWGGWGGWAWHWVVGWPVVVVSWPGLLWPSSWSQGLVTASPPASDQQPSLDRARVI